MPLDIDTKFALQLDWNLLRTFLIIAEEGSITRAAQRLLRGQPSVSLALQRLEGELGCRLIDRGHGTFRLTAAGRQLHAECAELFSGVARLPEMTHEAEREVSGEINIPFLLDDQLTGFNRRFGRVRFNIRTDTSARVVQGVQDKRASFGICLVNRRRSDLTYQMVYREFFGFYCGPAHPLFGRCGLTMADLKSYPTVSFDTDDINDALRPVALLRNQWGLDDEIVGRSSQLEEVRRMIQCGMGIGSLPIHVVERDVRDGFLWRLPPYDAPPRVDIYLVMNPRKRLTRAEDIFVTELRERIGNTPLDARTYLTEGTAP